MRFKLIFSITALMVIICGIGMVIPGIADYINHGKETGTPFFLAGSFTVLCGLIGRKIFKAEPEPLRAKEMFLTTTLIWLVFALFSALPFYFSKYDVSFTDAFLNLCPG